MVTRVLVTVPWHDSAFKIPDNSGQFEVCTPLIVFPW